MAVNEQNVTPGSVVVGYFPSGEDAQRAITELRDEGFQPNEIGAAFHSSSSGGASAGSPTSHRSVGKDVGELVGPATTGASGATGAKSDSGAVTPAGLASGSGTVTTGASRPGPIPGSEIPHHPHEIADEGVAERQRLDPASSGQPTSLAPGISPGTGEVADERTKTNHERAKEGEGWWSRLKHVFSDDTEHETSRAPESQSKNSMNFGTGEGHLGINPTGGSLQGAPPQYSGSAFETSFSNMGIPADHSRRLAHELRQGGAIVTVRGNGRVAEAERILERNGGRVRYESNASLPAFSESDVFAERVELFGDVRRSYRPISDRDRDDIRRAS